jgi:hypothetical protein
VEKPDTQQLLDKLPAAIAEARAVARRLRLWEELTAVSAKWRGWWPGSQQGNRPRAGAALRRASVETHRANIFSKLQCANDNELGRWLAAHPWLA